MHATFVSLLLSFLISLDGNFGGELSQDLQSAVPQLPSFLLSCSMVFFGADF